jgi:hypothetical protein
MLQRVDLNRSEKDRDSSSLLTMINTVTMRDDKASFATVQSTLIGNNDTEEMQCGKVYAKHD